MDCGRNIQMTPAVVSQRLCEVLLKFPAAAIGGVQWNVLARKYEDRYGTRLDLASVGHTTPIAAAATLLWDVLRVVSNEDTSNPVIGADDAVALTPRPGCTGTWPSLYQTLCALVQEHGSSETAQADTEKGTSPLECSRSTRGLLLSQLKPLLQRNWHPNFDENSFGFLSEDGNLHKMRKMKHLVQAVIGWRDQRMEWQRSTSMEPTAVDHILTTKLTLVVSKRHNDLLLQCPCIKLSDVVDGPRKQSLSGIRESAGVQRPTAARCEREWELALLQAEKARMLTRNSKLADAEMSGGIEEASILDPASLQQSDDQHPTTPKSTGFSDGNLATMTGYHEQVYIFDDPFEPPPQKEQFWSLLVASQTKFHLKGETMTPALPHLGNFSGTTTQVPETPVSSFGASSGAGTPAHTMGDNMCTVMPMWFSYVSSHNLLGDRCVIPTGIVEQIRSQFESAVGPDTAPPLPPSQYVGP
jgi:hypothetical protein